MIYCYISYNNISTNLTCKFIYLDPNESTAIISIPSQMMIISNRTSNNISQVNIKLSRCQIFIYSTYTGFKTFETFILQFHLYSVLNSSVGGFLWCLSEVLLSHTIIKLKIYSLHFHLYVINSFTNCRHMLCT